MNCYVYYKRMNITSTHWGVLHNEAYKMLEQILSDKYNLNLKSAKIVVNSNGKPHFSNRFYPHFNISHTKGGVIVCVADCDVGCDLEHDRKLTDGMTRRVFSPEELIILDNALSKDENQISPKLLLWTYKEAYLKLEGTGLYKGKDLKLIYPPAVEPGRLLATDSISYYQFIDNDLCGTVCLNAISDVNLIFI